MARKKIKREFLNDLEYKKIEANRSDLLASKIIRRYRNSYSLRRLYEKYNNKILNVIKKNRNNKEKLLDLGCGFGDFILDASKEVDFICGVDLGKKNIILAKNNTGNIKNVRLIRADGERLPIRNDCFDYVVMKGFIHHLGNPNMVFNEVKRVLKKGGMLIIFEGDVTSFYRKVILGLADLIRIEHESSLFSHLDYESIKSLLIKSQFTVHIEKISGLFVPLGLSGFGNKFIWKIFESLEMFLENRFPLFGWYVLITARK